MGFFEGPTLPKETFEGLKIEGKDGGFEVKVGEGGVLKNATTEAPLTPDEIQQVHEKAHSELIENWKTIKSGESVPSTPQWNSPAVRQGPIEFQNKVAGKSAADIKTIQKGFNKVKNKELKAFGKDEMGIGDKGIYEPSPKFMMSKAGVKNLPRDEAAMAAFNKDFAFQTRVGADMAEIPWVGDEVNGMSQETLTALGKGGEEGGFWNWAKDHPKDVYNIMMKTVLIAGALTALGVYLDKKAKEDTACFVSKPNVKKGENVNAYCSKSPDKDDCVGYCPTENTFASYGCGDNLESYKCSDSYVYKWNEASWYDPLTNALDDVFHIVDETADAGFNFLDFLAKYWWSIPVVILLMIGLRFMMVMGGGHS